MKQKLPLPGENWELSNGYPCIIMFHYYDVNYEKIDVKLYKQDSFTGQWRVTKKFQDQFGRFKYIP